MAKEGRVGKIRQLAKGGRVGKRRKSWKKKEELAKEGRVGKPKVDNNMSLYTAHNFWLTTVRYVFSYDFVHCIQL